MRSNNRRCIIKWIHRFKYRRSVQNVCEIHFQWWYIQFIQSLSHTLLHLVKWCIERIVYVCRKSSSKRIEKMHYVMGEEAKEQIIIMHRLSTIQNRHTAKKYMYLPGIKFGNTHMVHESNRLDFLLRLFWQKTTKTKKMKYLFFRSLFGQ